MVVYHLCLWFLLVKLKLLLLLQQQQVEKETLELVRAYYRLGERPRKRLLELAKALEGDTSSSGVA